MAAEKLEWIDPVDLVIIGLDTEHRSISDHPLYDERVLLELDAPLVKNIMVYGVQLPVIVRQEGGTFYVVDGRQRVRASRAANAEFRRAGEHIIHVPCRLSQGDDNRVQGIMISTNEHRRNDDILGKARKAAQRMDQCGDINQVAVDFGRSTKTIRNWLSLAKADPRIHAAIMTGTISSSAGVEISRRPRAEQRDLLDTTVRASQATPGATGGTVSEAAAKVARKGASRAAGVTARVQKGIKRIWLRKALKTAAAGALSDDQRKVLEWFTEGTAEQGDWFHKFRFDVESELAPPPAVAAAPAQPTTPATVTPYSEEGSDDEESGELTAEEIAKVDAARAGAEASS